MSLIRWLKHLKLRWEHYPDRVITEVIDWLVDLVFFEIWFVVGYLHFRLATWILDVFLHLGWILRLPDILKFPAYFIAHVIVLQLAYVGLTFFSYAWGVIFYEDE